MGNFKPHTMRSTLSEGATGLLAALFTVYAGMAIAEKQEPRQGVFACVAERLWEGLKRPDVWDPGHGLRAQGEVRKKVFNCSDDPDAANEMWRIISPIFR